jgi:hypothetical protein
LSRRGAGEATVRRATATVEQAWQTGVLPAPGMVWMPPVYIQ